MSEFSLRGMGVAMVTPFKSDRGVDYDAMGRLIDYLIENGASYLVVMATTGETPTLSEAEHSRILSFVRERASGRVPLVLGAGSNNTVGLGEFLSNADLEGYSAILSVVPYYNKPTQEGIFCHYKYISEKSPVPVILYNVPGRTGVNMEAETTLRLARECPNIVGIKEASGRLDQVKEIIANAPEGFSVISGDDGITLPLIGMGAVGVISVLGNAFPALFSEMVASALNGDNVRAAKINDRFTELYTLLFADGNPAGIKFVLSRLGLVENILRLPLTAVTQPTADRIREVLESKIKQ